MKLPAVLRSRATLVGLGVGVPLSAVFLWLAVRNADPEEVWDALSGANLAYVVLAVVMNGFVYVGQVARWRRIARTPQVPARRFAEMVLSGLAVNDVLPGRVGDLLRARWLQVDSGLPAGRALSTVFVDRAFDVLTLVIFLAVSLPFVTAADWLVRIAIGGVALLIAIVAVLVGARLYTRRRARDRRSRGMFRRILRDTLEGLADPLGRKRGATLLGISLAAWSMWCVAAWLVGRSVGIELSVLDTLFVASIVNLGLAIPSSPGFIGTYQWLCVSALAVLDVGTDQALAFSILLHAIWYVPTLLVGGSLLLRRGLRSVRAVSTQADAPAEANTSENAAAHQRP